MAIGAAGHDDADRRLDRRGDITGLRLLVGLLHDADLYRRGMGAQHALHPVRRGRHEEGVVHFARRMSLGEVERREVVPVGLDVRPFGNRESHVGKDRGDLVGHLADRMNAAGCGRRGANRQRDINALGGEPGFECLCLQLGALGLDPAGHLVLEPVDRRAGHLALVRGHLAQGRQQCRDGALLADGSDPQRFNCRFVLGGVDLGEQLVAKCLCVGHRMVQCQRFKFSKTKSPAPSRFGRRKA